MNRSLSMDRMIFLAIVGVALVAGLMPATDAAAQACFEHVNNWPYTPTDCQARPDIDRVFRLQTITWKNHEYLFVDEGNEIKIFNIDNPQNPSTVTTSRSASTESPSEAISPFTRTRPARSRASPFLRARCARLPLTRAFRDSSGLRGRNSL